MCLLAIQVRTAGYVSTLLSTPDPEVLLMMEDRRDGIPSLPYLYMPADAVVDQVSVESTRQ